MPYLAQKTDGTARKYGARVLQLHGNMAPDEQDEVLRPSGGGSHRRRRRVILSIPIAESSVTIDGVTAVVDCGLRRAPRYDPATAINRLETVGGYKFGSSVVGWLRRFVTAEG